MTWAKLAVHVWLIWSVGMFLMMCFDSYRHRDDYDGYDTLGRECAWNAVFALVFCGVIVAAIAFVAWLTNSFLYM